MKKIIAGVAVAGAALLGVAACSSEEEPETKVVTEPCPEVTEEETAPESQVEEEPGGEASDSDSAGPAEVEVPPVENFVDSETFSDPFTVKVTDAYVDEDGQITDEWGDSAVAPEGMELVIFSVTVTNDGTEPTMFDDYDTMAYDADGRSYVTDFDASFLVSGDYAYDYVNPGQSIDTGFAFIVPEDAELVEVDVAGTGTLVNE